MLGDWQGIKLEPARAERMAQPGGVFELISGMRNGLFNLDMGSDHFAACHLRT